MYHESRWSDAYFEKLGLKKLNIDPFNVSWRRVMGREKGATILGIHLEGPFISPKRLGVQRPETVRAVDLDLLHRLYLAGEGHIVNM